MASDATTVSPDAPRATGLAQRYAQALLDLARERRSVDQVASDMEALQALWRDDAPFRAFVSDPRLDAAQQRKGAFAVLERAGLDAMRVSERDLLDGVAMEHLPHP